MTLDKRGTHPNSIANLVHTGRPSEWGETKKKRNPLITETAWLGLHDIAAQHSCSTSELLERIGRGLFVICPVQSADKQ